MFGSPKSVVALVTPPRTPTAAHLTQAIPVVNDTGPIPLPIVPPLRDHYLAKPHPQRLSPRHPRFAEISSRHTAALAEGAPCYIDPDSGLTVFTAAFLADRGYCCDSGCRHCPFVTD